eukprot:9110569-Alexandrium_andersonii.AAC.1
MSASLVGSEMCIRDRRRSGGGKGPHSKASMIDWRTGSAQATNRTPVSYTHLTLPTICSV